MRKFSSIATSEALEPRLLLTGAIPQSEASTQLPHPQPSLAEDLTIERLGAWGGQTESIAVDGKYAYVGIGLNVVVFDVSDSARPREVGRAQLAGDSWARELVVSNSKVYAAAGGLQIIDVSDPARPILIANYQDTERADDVAVSGSTVYLAEWSTGLHIIDASDPYVPRTLVVLPGTVSDVAVWGSTAYVANEKGLSILDVSDPANPLELGLSPVRSSALFASESLIYAGNGWSLQVIDAANPSQPALLGSCPIDDSPTSVFVQGTVAYIAQGSPGLKMVDVSNPRHPVTMGTYKKITQSVFSAIVSGSIADTTDRWGGLRLIDVSDPRRSFERSSYNVSDRSQAVFVSGPIAYVAEGRLGLNILDVSDPEHPELLGRWFDNAPVSAVVISGSIAYLAEEYAGLQILDVTDPAHPVRLGTYDPVGFVTDVFVLGSTAYLACSDKGMHIVDVSDPAHPAFLSRFFTERVTDVFVQPGIAYVAGYSGLQVFDVSNPHRPRRIGTYPHYDFILDIFVSGSLAFITDSSGLEILNVEVPATPVLVSSYKTRTAASAISVADSLAYVGTWSDAMLIFDVSDPENPIKMATSPTSGAYGLFIVGGSLAYAAGGVGLKIFRLGVSQPPGVVHLSNQLAQISGSRLLVYASPQKSGTPTTYPLDQIEQIRIDEGGEATLEYSDRGRITVPPIELAAFSSLRLADDGGPLTLSSLSLGAAASFDPGNKRVLLRNRDAREVAQLIRYGQVRSLSPGGARGVSLVQVGRHVRLRSTWRGDVNLDGRIDAEDYRSINRGFASKPATPTYLEGDFNFDSRIDADDYFIIDEASLDQRNAVLSSLKPALSRAIKRIPRISLFSTKRLSHTN